MFNRMSKNMQMLKQFRPFQPITDNSNATTTHLPVVPCALAIAR